MDGIKEIADSFGAELKHRLPKQRKTKRTKLALLVATMLDVRSANLMRPVAAVEASANSVLCSSHPVIELLPQTGRCAVAAQRQNARAAIPFIDCIDAGRD